ncbi:MAG TPA: 3D-(3,5/4)-trihydroxycyclohexane-1,2-dione acylhydrolase (decyclizing) [Acidimicrobiales bacterium]|nr:3D-(3,5/4)-trihydroxycyclohexane-1,2-dione acylhydrolase (decyclizing) [Acidimicrobiales bacterium]
MRLTTAQALARYLSRQYSVFDGERERLVPAVLGIFGHGNVAGLGQALDELGGELPFVQGRNEQSLVHLASGYTKARRRRSTLAVTASIGPGSTNMVTGAALATINRLPVLLLPSDAYATRLQGSVLQQLEHSLGGDVTVNDCFRPVARFFDRVTRPEQLLAALPEAMRVLTSPSEAGAVVVSLPQDVQGQAYDYPEAFFDEGEWEISRAVPRMAALRAAAELLAAAERPLVIAGGGVRYSGAEAELATFAETFGVPVAETFAGKGSVLEDAWWSLGGVGVEGNPAANAVARDADLVLCVGTRLTDFTTASRSLFADPGVRFVSCNVNDRDARKEGALRVVGDAKLSLAGLLEEARALGAKPHESLRIRCEQVKASWFEARRGALEPPAEGRLTQGQLIGILQEIAQPGDTLVAAAGSPVGDLLKAWDATGDRRCHLEFGYSCMGYELPGALGVRLAGQLAGERGCVTALIGDGTFVMQPSEIATALQEGLQVTFVLSQNDGYQVIRRLQMDRVGHSFGNEFRHREGPLPAASLTGDYLELDLVSIARGLGAHACRASSSAEVRAALLEARHSEGPSVVVVPVEPYANLPASEVWWDIAPAEVAEQEGVAERRRIYEEARKAQRWFG